MTESRDEIPDETLRALFVADTFVPAIWLTFNLVRLRKLDVWTEAAMTVLNSNTDATCQFIRFRNKNCSPSIIKE